MNETYAEVLVQAVDTEGLYDGVCSASLIFASPTGATIRILEEAEGPCTRYNYGDHENFRFLINISEQDAEYGRDYQFTLQIVFQSKGKQYVKTSDYAVKINPRLNAAFDVTTDGLIAQTNAAASRTIGNENLHFLWDWGDGSTLENTTSPSTQHLYHDSGAYSITLTTTDPFGQVKTTTQTLVVRDVERSVPILTGPTTFALLVAVAFSRSRFT